MILLKNKYFTSLERECQGESNIFVTGTIFKKYQISFKTHQYQQIFSF